MPDDPIIREALKTIRDAEKLLEEYDGVPFRHTLSPPEEFRDPDLDRGVRLISATDGIDSSTATGRMMSGVLGSLAEYERELIKERTALKRQAYLAAGGKFGRPKKVKDSDHIETARRMKAGGHAARDIAKYLGVSRATLYRYLAEADEDPTGPRGRAA